MNTSKSLQNNSRLVFGFLKARVFWSGGLRPKYCLKNDELVKRTIKENEKKKGSVLIKAVIAGEEPILKCLLTVFNELKYKIQKYKSDKNENIKELKFITREQAIKIEKKNLKTDMWQTLFFVTKT